MGNALAYKIDADFLTLELIECDDDGREWGGPTVHIPLLQLGAAIAKAEGQTSVASGSPSSPPEEEVGSLVK